MLKIYGIKNCDTLKKSLKWAEEKGLEFTFHDYRKEGVTEALLKSFIATFDLDILVNKRGTTWRKLPDELKDQLDEESALKIMMDNPAIIKRPIFVTGSEKFIGFSKKDQIILNEKF
jgi:Spx/MgsR family transcriptional regulator